MGKFIIFIAIMTFVLILSDIYVIRSWTKYSKSRNWHKWTRILPWVIAIIITPVMIYTNLYRDRIDLGYSMQIMLMSVTLWYLPKLIILPVILLKDSFLFIKNKFSKSKIIDVEEKTVSNSVSRREFVAGTGWTLAGAPFIITGYGMFKTTYDYRIHEATLNLPNLPESLSGLRIVQLSDLHAGSFYSAEPFEKVCSVVNMIQADIITLTGDFVNFEPSELDKIQNGLKSLYAMGGVYGCLGNHDHFMNDEKHKILRNKLEKAEIDILYNENRKIYIGNQYLQLAGVDNTGMKQQYADFNKSLHGLNPEEAIVMMCHDPTNWDKSIRNKLPVNLTLSGHTHGGQFGLEWSGKVLSPGSWIYKQWAGLYQSGNQYIYVNRGLGTTGPPVRVGINPEITVITLKRANSIV